MATRSQSSGRKLPRWQQEFYSAYAACPTEPHSGLLSAILPLADAARAQLRTALDSSSLAPPGRDLSDALRNSFEVSLFDRLDQAASKTLVVELGYAAGRGLLVGETPGDRHAFFCQCLTDRAFSAALMAQYPCLVRRIMSVVALWHESALELLTRLENDIAIIRKGIFGGADLQQLESVVALGDPHVGGRAVHRLTFTSGALLIYKPRPAAMEKGIHDLVTWADDRGLSPDLWAPAALDRRTHGWVAHVDYGPCADAAALKRFYARQGANLALTYIIGASDLHYENIIAAGEYPVLVDLETLFQSRPRHGYRSATGAALDIINTSVLRTLMLPARVSGDNPNGLGERRADISALGFTEQQNAPFASIVWEDSETDAMRMAERYMSLGSAASLPTLEGQTVGGAGHVEDIVSGFERAYEFFSTHRRALCALRGPLSIFRGKTIRQVLRPTALYCQMLGESWHPSFAVDPARLKTHLRKRLRSHAIGNNALRVAERSEIADFMNGDVPYFRSTVGGSHANSIIKPELRVGLTTRGWRDCVTRVQTLSEADRDRQVWLTRVSFADCTNRVSPSRSPATVFHRGRAMELATAIGNRLCDLAIAKNGGTSWLFPMQEDGHHLTAGAVGYDLYNGLPGISLFLAQLSLTTKNQRHRAMAKAAMHEALLLERMDRHPPIPGGALAGSASLAYALALIGRWLDQPEWVRRAKQIVRANAKSILAFPLGDFISGHAGFLTAGIAVAEATEDRTILANLRPIALALQKAPPDECPADGDCGLAHGKGGLGIALARWAKASEQSSELIRAMDMINLELVFARKSRTRNSPESGDRPAMLAWCRGGLGVALAGLQLGLPVLPEVKHLVRALNSTDLRNMPLCPCHGAIGALEFLRAAQRAGIEEANITYARMRAETFGRIRAGEWCSDHAHRLESPGLLMGIAGTGYSLLRMLDNSRVPSVLTMSASGA